jgi:hypothetical protein
MSIPLASVVERSRTLAAFAALANFRAFGGIEINFSF